MRYLIVCDSNIDSSIITEMTGNDRLPSNRLIILSSRRGLAWQKGSVLSVPVRWGLEETPSCYRSLKYKINHRLKKAIALAAGLRVARFFPGIEQLLLQIDACDPDVIDLRKLGKFGRWLKSRCMQRFPGRKVLACADSYMSDENATSWRTYDPTVLVSIILPVYNGQKYLGLSIESCLTQTHQNFELVIVDDGSSDNTPTIIEKYAAADDRIKLIRNKKNLGLPESLNVGFEFSQGEFLTWFQSDNLYTPTAVAYMVQQLCTFPKIGLVYCSSHRIDEAGNPATPFYFDATFPPAALARWTVISGPF